jgi:hypothetical protein
MKRYFTTAATDHSVRSFRMLILVDEKRLQIRHLQQYGPDDYILEETVTTDRYTITHFLRRGECAGWQWQEIDEIRQQPYEQHWQELYRESAG